MPMFVGICCEMSFYVFSKTNPIRTLCYRLIKHPAWEQIVIILISLSSVKLAYDTFYLEDTSTTTGRYYFSIYAD